VVGGEDHLPAESEAVQTCLLSFLDGSLRFLSVTQSVLATHNLSLLLTQLAVFALYNLDPNWPGILITNNANIFINPLYNTEVLCKY